jgi:hypothetical protein
MDSSDDLLLKRKVFISTVGWIGGITSSLLIFFLTLQGVKILVITESAVYKDFFGDGDSELSQSFFDIYTMMFLIFGLIVVFSIFFLISSIGLLKYKNWGRLSFISISWGMIIISISAILFYLLFQNDVLSVFSNTTPTIEGFDDSMTKVMRVILAIQMASYGILLIVINRMLFKIIRRFRSNDYRTLFH